MATFLADMPEKLKKCSIVLGSGDYVSGGKVIKFKIIHCLKILYKINYDL